MGPFIGPGPNSAGAVALRQAGEAFFGTQWQTDLAAALSALRGSTVDPAHVRRWNAGGRTIPPWVFQCIERIAAERRILIDAAIEEIKERHLTTTASPDHLY